MQNILLINPHTPAFIKQRNRSIPTGLLYLAENLKKNNYNVKLIDVNNDFLDIEHAGKKLDINNYFSNKFIKEVNSFKPDLIGVGCLFSGRFKPALLISKILKKKYPNVPIVLGGIHPTTFPKEILNEYSFIDYIILGEGEYSFLELIKANNDKRLLRNVDGLAFREEGRIIITKKKEKKKIENLDELNWPTYDLIDLKRYYFDTSNWYNPKNLPINIPLPIISSRGCPNQCDFCSMFLVHGRGYRIRSPKKVVDEIEYLYKKYNHRYFSFMDDNFTLIKKRTIEIADEIIDRNLNIQFDTPNGISINTLDKEVIDKLVGAGLVRTCVAIESGSEYMRNKIMKKNLPTEKIYEFFDAIKDYKQLYVKAFFMVGYPQETKETLNETYEMVKKIPVKQVAFFFVIPYPNTGLFDYCKKNNLLNLSKKDLRNIHNNEIFSQCNESDNPFIKPYELTIEELISFRKKVYNLINKRRTKLCLLPIEF